MSDQLFEEASTWFVRLQADDITPAERADFARWRAQSAAHAAAFEQVRALFSAMAVEARIQHPTRPSPPPAPALPRRRLTLAGLVLTACLGGLWVWPPGFIQDIQSDYHTATGERQRVVLADGSRILLNTDTALKVDLTGHGRRVELLRGEAFFEVSHAPDRPFL